MLVVRETGVMPSVSETGSAKAPPFSLSFYAAASNRLPQLFSACLQFLRFYDILEISQNEGALLCTANPKFKSAR